MRWTFEALMAWKFGDGSQYFDGLTYLSPFGFGTFQLNEIFAILTNFIIISGCVAFVGKSTED